MTFDDYQKKATKTNLMKGRDAEVYYFALGLTGEAGEVSNKMKKILRDHNGDLSTVNASYVTKEIGDVLWYASMICEVFGVKLGDVAQANIDKLASRQERGVLGGAGDNR